MSTQYAVVITTTSNKDDAKIIATTLLEKRLAACIQVLPMESFYTWKGEVAQEEEQLLLIKTRTELYGSVESAIKAIHKYDVPEVVLVAIEGGLHSYLSWIDEVTSRD